MMNILSISTYQMMTPNQTVILSRELLIRCRIRHSMMLCSELDGAWKLYSNDNRRLGTASTASTAIGETTMFPNENEIWDLGESSERAFRQSSERERELRESSEKAPRVERKLRNDCTDRAWCVSLL